MECLYMVIPCYNEEEVILDSAGKLKEKINSLIEAKLISSDSKIVLVDDGSRDKTWQHISSLNNEDKIFVGLKLAHNKGHQNAVVAGIEYAYNYASMVISMDADLQDDINAIDKMVNEYYQGNEIVYGVRSKRDTDTFFKRESANLYYKLLKKMGIEIIDNHADFRLMSKRVCEEFLKYKESNLFLRGIIPSLGFKSTIVEYERKERLAGETKYPLKRMLALAWDGITSFSLKPLRLISTLGTILITLSLITMIVFSFLFGFGVFKISYEFYILTSIWLATGIILTMLEIVAEYVGKIYSEVKNRPRYIVEEIKK